MDLETISNYDKKIKEAQEQAWKLNDEMDKLRLEKNYYTMVYQLERGVFKGSKWGVTRITDYDIQLQEIDSESKTRFPVSESFMKLLNPDYHETFYFNVDGLKKQVELVFSDYEAYMVIALGDITEFCKLSGLTIDFSYEEQEIKRVKDQLGVLESTLEAMRKIAENA